MLQRQTNMLCTNTSRIEWKRKSIEENLRNKPGWTIKLGDELAFNNVCKRWYRNGSDIDFINYCCPPNEGYDKWEICERETQGHDQLTQV